MRMTLVLVLAVLGQWGMPANAQPQAGAQPASGAAATKEYLTHQPPKRLFFFMSDPKNMGRPAMFGRPSQAPEDLWRFLKPKNSRLFFFAKP